MTDSTSCWSSCLHLTKTLASSSWVRPWVSRACRIVAYLYIQGYNSVLGALKPKGVEDLPPPLHAVDPPDRMNEREQDERAKRKIKIERKRNRV